MSAASHWKGQRQSALLLIPLTLWLLLSVATLSSADYDEIRLWLTQPLTLILLTLLLLAAAYHAVIGMQVVLEDYLRGAIRKRTITMSQIVLTGAALVGLASILSLFIGVA